MTVEEEEVDKEFFAGELEAELIGDEGEALTDLHDEVFDVTYYFVLKDTLIL